MHYNNAIPNLCRHCKITASYLWPLQVPMYIEVLIQIKTNPCKFFFPWCMYTLFWLTVYSRTYGHFKDSFSPLTTNSGRLVQHWLQAIYIVLISDWMWFQTSFDSLEWNINAKICNVVCVCRNSLSLDCYIPAVVRKWKDERLMPAKRRQKCPSALLQVE